MARGILCHRSCAVMFLLCLVHGSLGSSGFANLSEAIPSLQQLYDFPLRRNPRLGGQNFTVCCLKAVNASYQFQNGQASQNVNTQNRFIDLTPDQLNDTQFPCGATYNGSDAGAPLVTIPYSWCSSNCGGWEQSTNRILTQWIQPFVGFILPAAVFCLNVPRKMGLAISDKLFPGRFDDIVNNFKEIKFRGLTQGDILKNLLELIFSAIKFCSFLVLVLVEMVLRGGWAASIALGDTIIWVGIVFSTSAPMILSGLYEATLDRKIIESIQNKSLTVGQHRKPRLYLEIHLLYSVLVGNLSLNHPPADSKIPQSERHSAWDDIGSLVAPFAPSSQELNGEIDMSNQIRNGTKVRLKGMLECQASFGAAIGAPVVFFLGSFFFSVFSDLTTVGDNDTSHALAFGMWWMTIPHVAIVSGCLLAGNNPNTLEVIMCGIHPWDPEVHGRDKHWWHYLNLYRSFYDSVYQPVWMWERGRSKRQWIRRVQKEFEEDIVSRDQGLEISAAEQHENDRTLPQHDNFKLDVKDWTSLILVATALLAAPLILAFLTSFYTPAIGMSCRSFTFLLYFLFQTWLSLIWFWDFQREERSPLTRETTWPSGRKITVPSFYCLIISFGFLGSAFTAIAGTFMQILGVYRNCLCNIPMSAWSSGDYSIVISTNSADDIRLAEHFWLPTGITSIVALILVCYIGWWYQRHWRRRFTVLVNELKIDGESTSVEKQPDAKVEQNVQVNPVIDTNGVGNQDEIVRSL